MSVTIVRPPELVECFWCPECNEGFESLNQARRCCGSHAEEINETIYCEECQTQLSDCTCCQQRFRLTFDNPHNGQLQIIRPMAERGFYEVGAIGARGITYRVVVHEIQMEAA